MDHEAAVDDGCKACEDLWLVHAFMIAFPEVNVRVLGGHFLLLVEQALRPLCEFLLELVEITFELMLVYLCNITKSINYLSDILRLFEFLDNIIEAWPRPFHVFIDWHLAAHSTAKHDIARFTLHF